MDVDRKWTFCIIGQWVGGKSQVNRLYNRKEVSNTNVLASTHIKREKASLPVDVHRSEMSLLKLPIVTIRTFNLYGNHA